MIVQECGGFELLELPRDPQAVMMLAQRQFQQDLVLWDDRISRRPPTFVLPGRVLHNLDCAVQEASEAWDMLEGGWKHHKRNPKPIDVNELTMEVVDVAAYLFNALLFMGSDLDQQLIAASLTGSPVCRIIPPSAGMDYGWMLGTNAAVRDAAILVYGHGKKAHGQDWVKVTAALVNCLRTQIVEAASTLRLTLKGMRPEQRFPEAFPANPGWLWMDVMPSLYGVADSIPGVDQARFFSAFMHKAGINQQRRAGGY